MKKTLLFYAICCILLISGCTTPSTQSIKILQFNIWQEGTVVENGYEAIISQIIQSKADFVTLSEVRNYNNTNFTSRVVESLKDSGYTFYSDFSDDSGLLSKYPIQEFTAIYPLSNDEGSAYKALIDMDGQEVALYTCHLDYRNCTYYDIYGYSGNTWDKLDAPLLDLDSILANNIASKRDDAMKEIIAAAQEDIAQNRLVFIGGDYNEPSHLDWSEETKDLYSHQGLVVPWTVTTLLEEAGFIDSYRAKYPNPITHPGFTFPSANPAVGINLLSWAPEADERDRIDYIHYAPNKNLTLEEAVIWGPTGSICNGEIIEENTEDIFQIGQGIWPTDHKAVLVTFNFKK